LVDIVSRETGEDFWLITKDQKVRVGTGMVRIVGLAGVKLNQPFWLGHRSRAKQHGIDDAKNRGVRADAHRKRNNRNCSEARST
jgi:hypothetical protein